MKPKLKVVAPPLPGPHPPPASLSDAARAIWADVAPTLATRGVLTPDLTPLVANYCAELAAVAEFDSIMAREGLTVTGAGGITRPHPLARPRAQASARLIQLGKRLGIFPGQQKASAPDGDQDAYARLGLLD